MTVAREDATDLAPGKVQWIARVWGKPTGRAILVIADALMVGTVAIDREVFRISYLGDGVRAVADVDPAAFLRD